MIHMRQDVFAAMRLDVKNDLHYMKEAIKQAKKAYDMNEVPVGCVIVYNDKIIARGYNKREASLRSV